MSLNKDIENYYTQNIDQIEEQYDSKTFEAFRNRVRVLINSGILKPERALDIGAGLGHYADILAKEFDFDVLAVEPNVSMRERGQKKFSNKKIQWKNDSLPKLSSLESQKFDFIILISSFHYLDKENKKKTLQRLPQLLNDGGLIMLTYPYPESREYQHSISEQDMRDMIKGVVTLKLDHFEMQPYPVKSNKKAQQNKSSRLVYELVKR